MARLSTRMILSGTAVAALGLGGCAGTYDTITSQRFKERPFHTLFSSDDPIYVLENVQEGDARVRAMKKLKEPKEHGGSTVAQDKAIAILQASATTDKRPLCRLAAVDALSRFKDPRAGVILITAYQNAPYDSPPVPGAAPEISTTASFAGVKGAISNFTPETVTGIQCLVLQSLGEQRGPDSLNLLIRVAAANMEKTLPKPGDIEAAGASVGLDAAFRSSEADPIDVRLAAIRSLGNYKGNRAAALTLIAVLRVEKDVAVRGRAHESLCKITDEDLPPDANAWVAWMEKGGMKPR